MPHKIAVTAHALRRWAERIGPGGYAAIRRSARRAVRAPLPVERAISGSHTIAMVDELAGAVLLCDPRPYRSAGMHGPVVLTVVTVLRLDAAGVGA